MATVYLFWIAARLTRIEDGQIKTAVCRKATDTDQYLNVDCHHPKHKQPGVVITSM